jgi:hypothetical protein
MIIIEELYRLTTAFALEKVEYAVCGGKDQLDVELLNGQADER